MDHGFIADPILRIPSKSKAVILFPLKLEKRGDTPLNVDRVRGVQGRYFVIALPMAAIFNVTTHPTADWIARQITEAFPWNEAPRHLIGDRDQVYGAAATRRLRAMGIRDKPIAPGSPWQNDASASTMWLSWAKRTYAGF